MTGPTGPGIPPIVGPTGGQSTGSTGPLTGTGSFQLPITPYPITSVTFQLMGGNGESAGGGGGGYGGEVTAIIYNPSINTIYTYIIGSDGAGGSGGAYSGSGSGSGGSGGDCSSISINGTYFMIAGGGGGYGGGNTLDGGNGCFNNTFAGGVGQTDTSGGAGGGGGSIITSGIGGTGGVSNDGGSAGNSGGNFPSLSGGVGGYGDNGGGGGGGNGYGGGGGGGGANGYTNNAGGGGAGGSYVNPSYSNTISYTTSSTSGQLTITWNYYTNPVLQYDVANNILFYNSKTFVIEHPLNINKYLVHACLEGPEAGVYYRGTAIINSDFKSVDIYLADYVDYLAKEFTIYVSPIVNDPNNIPVLGTSPVIKGKFTVYSNIVPCEFNYIVFGKRQNIEVEPLKALTHVKGDGPYKYTSTLLEKVWQKNTF